MCDRGLKSMLNDDDNKMYSKILKLKFSNNYIKQTITLFLSYAINRVVNFEIKNI